MATLELTKEEIIVLIKGLYVPYEHMEYLEKLGYGRYYGGFQDTWHWDTSKLNNESTESVLYVYQSLKKKLK